MIAMLAAFALLLSPKAQSALDRFEAFMKAAQTAEFQYEAITAGNPFVGQCTLIWQRPSDQYFVCKWQSSDFEYRQNGNGWIEQDNIALQYVIGKPEPLDRPSGIMSRIPDYAYPLFLLTGELKRIVDPNRWQFRGNEKVNGVAADHLYARLGGETDRLEAWIDSTGAMRRWHIVEMRPTGTFDVQFDFKTVKVGGVHPANKFNLNPPLQFVPRFLPEFLWPVGIGSKFPFGSWKDARKSEVVDVAAIASGKVTLVLLTSADCDASLRAESAFRDATKLVEKKGGQVVEILSGEGASVLDKKAPRSIFLDADGSFVQSINVAATPALFLVTKEGLIEWCWMGYDDADPNAISRALVKHWSQEE